MSCTQKEPRIEHRVLAQSVEAERYAGKGTIRVIAQEEVIVVEVFEEEDAGRPHSLEVNLQDAALLASLLRKAIALSDEAAHVGEGGES